MDDANAYLFDLSGFLVVADCIEQPQLQQLQHIMEQRLDEETLPEDNHIRFPRWRIFHNQTSDNAILPVMPSGFKQRTG